MTASRIPRLLAFAVALFVQAMLLAVPAMAAERRVALVVGIGAYQSAPALPNPPRDAHAIAQTLAKLGFDVDEKIDIDNRQFARSLREFGIKAQTADVAVFYFAGHGMQVDRENYLVPADAKLEREHDLVYEAMRLDLVLGEASQARKLGIVMLDACRNNPFVGHLTQIARSTRSAHIAQGLARVDDPPKGTIVAMATRADAVAEDGDGDHSPYTQALLNDLQKPGVELGLFFREVRDAVLAATYGQQEPYTFGSLGAEAFYFNPEPPNQPPVVPVLAPIEMPDNAGTKPLAIAGVHDPDGDQVVARVTGLPKGGSMRLGDRVILIGDTLTADQLAQLTFTPDGSFTGQAGPFTFQVEDGRGASVPASLFIKILPSHRPPVVEEAREVLAVSNAQGITQALGIREPISPDGRPMTVAVTTIPDMGVVRRDSGEELHAGDRLSTEALTRLAYDPGSSPGGDAGSFTYTVDDGQGGKVSGHLQITVVGAPSAVVAQAPVPQAAPKAEVRQPPAERPAEGPPPTVADASLPAPRPPEAAPPASHPAQEGVAKAPANPQLALNLPPEKAARDQSGRDCEHCPAMVEVPSGSFMMGAAWGDPSSRPVHRVSLRKGFAISKTVITAGEWRACVSAGACKPVNELNGAPDDSPARNVSWDDTQDYVAWLSKTTGLTYRLPSEAEWEYAARAGTTTAYWWGDQLGRGHADCQDCGGTFHKDEPELVTAFPANPFGLYGMGGGVAQWVADCWYPSHAGAPHDGHPREKANCHQRVIRGGSWRNDHSYAQSASRFYYEPDVRYIGNGFRVVREER